MEKVNVDLKLTCRKCGKSTPLKDLSYAANRKDLYCTNCLGGTYSLPKVEQKIKNKTNKTPYTCRKCNYQFTIRINTPYTERCPYCGRNDYLEKNTEFTTSRILREVSERYG